MNNFHPKSLKDSFEKDQKPLIESIKPLLEKEGLSNVINMARRLKIISDDGIDTRNESKHQEILEFLARLFIVNADKVRSVSSIKGGILDKLKNLLQGNDVAESYSNNYRCFWKHVEPFQEVCFILGSRDYLYNTPFVIGHRIRSSEIFLTTVCLLAYLDYGQVALDMLKEYKDKKGWPNTTSFEKVGKSLLERDESYYLDGKFDLNKKELTKKIGSDLNFGGFKINYEVVRDAESRKRHLRSMNYQSDEESYESESVDEIFI